jgi:hypothetical protein
MRDDHQTGFSIAAVMSMSHPRYLRGIGGPQFDEQGRVAGSDFAQGQALDQHPVPEQFV